MSKTYGINLGYIPLEKEQYKELKNTFIKDCSKDELFDAIDDNQFILEKFSSDELLTELLHQEDSAWIYDNIYGKDLEDLQDEVIRDINNLKPDQIKDLKANLIYYNEGIVLPTDNLNDLAKAEFILENFDKIKIENIKL